MGVEVEVVYQMGTDELSARWGVRRESKKEEERGREEGRKEGGREGRALFWVVEASLVVVRLRG